jgi:hypothetical protein
LHLLGAYRHRLDPAVLLPLLEPHSATLPGGERGNYRALP